MRLLASRGRLDMFVEPLMSTGIEPGRLEEVFVFDSKSENRERAVDVRVRVRVRVRGLMSQPQSLG